jgi:hypothetical protein
MSPYLCLPLYRRCQVVLLPLLEPWVLWEFQSLQLPRHRPRLPQLLHHPLQLM